MLDGVLQTAKPSADVTKCACRARDSSKRCKESAASFPVGRTQSGAFDIR